MNSVLEGIGKEAVMTSFEVQYQHLPEGTEENYSNP
jgi:hypothetical protein